MGPREIEIRSLLPWVEVRYSRSPGPGGQNVNKVSTRVTLLFDVASCTKLTASQKARIRQRLKTRLSREGRIRVVCHRERSQARNRAAAQRRLSELLCDAIRKPKPRRRTRPTAASRERRLATKRRCAELKRQRSAVRGE